MKLKMVEIIFILSHIKKGCFLIFRKKGNLHKTLRKPIKINSVLTRIRGLSLLKMLFTKHVMSHIFYLIFFILLKISSHL